MNITNAINRAVQLRAIIANAKKELDTIESYLESVALNGPHVPLEDESREGKRYIATTDDGNILPINLESDSLTASFSADSNLVGKIYNITGQIAFAELFRAKNTYERKITDGHKFRLACFEQLPEKDAAKLIDLLKVRDKSGTPKSRIVIAWDKL